MSGKPSMTLAKNDKKTDEAEEDEDPDGMEKPRQARATKPVEKPQEKPVAPAPREGGVRGFFKRLFGKT